MNAAAHLTADERGIILHCPRCNRANRVPFARLRESGHCAQCKSPLPAPAAPVEIASAAAFTALTRGSALPVLIDFWAPWCGPCQMIAPEVAKVAAMAAGELLVAKVNTEDLPQLGSTLGIRSIPTFAVFVGGREVERTSGGMPAAQLRAFALRAASQKGSHA
jgi:thioredoxin 2